MSAWTLRAATAASGRTTLRSLSACSSRAGSRRSRTDRRTGWSIDRVYAALASGQAVSGRSHAQFAPRRAQFLRVQAPPMNVLQVRRMTRRFLEAAIWPLCLIANTAPIVAAAILAPHLVPQIAAATTAALLLVLLAIEQALPFRPEWSADGDSDVWRDVGHMFAYAALAMNAARFGFLVVLARAVTALHLTDRFGLWPRASPFWLQVVAVIVIGDALEYLYHRLAHSHPLLWRLHAVHHTPVRMNVLKGARHHFLYAFGRGVVVWLPLLVLGAPAALIYWQFIAETITGLAGHANIRFRIPAFLHRLVVTPEYHRIHHASDPRLAASNFGAVVPFWDMLFDTHIDPLRVSVQSTGILDDPIPRRFVAELASPLTYGRLIARRSSAGPPSPMDRDA
ncbi:MAG TPA: sterol desaturase family protein [Kofleriaceae bacterium]